MHQSAERIDTGYAEHVAGGDELIDDPRITSTMADEFRRALPEAQ